MRRDGWDDSGLFHSGEGTLEKVKNIYVVHLRGTYEEMGRQHAAFASEVCGDLVLKYMGGLIEKLVGHSVPCLATPAGWALKTWFHVLNRGRLSEDIRDHLRGVAAGLHLKPSWVETVFIMPDILHYLAGRAMVSLAVPPMCTGFSARSIRFRWLSA